MKPFSHQRISIKLLLIAVLTGIGGFTTPRLFETVENVPVSDLFSRLPIAISKRILLSGKCSVQLYGWAFEKPGPTDGADEYLKIDKLDALLASQGRSFMLFAKPRLSDSVSEHIQEIDVPRSGNIEIKIQSYAAPTKDLKSANIFLSCENSGLRRVPGILFMISAISGLVGIALALLYGTRTVFRR